MPSVSALLFLAGNEVAGAKGGRLSMGCDVPCRDVQVDIKDLAGVLVAAELRALRDAGAVTLAVESKKGLLGTKSRVAVRRGGGSPYAAGIGAGLVAALSDKDPWARELVYRWIGRDSANPWGAVVGAVEAELVDAGYLAYADTGGMKGKLGALAHGRQRVTADCARIAELDGEIKEAVAAWHAFRQSDPVAEALVKECKDAVSARVESA